ncbi:hypothetical protein AL020_03610 [Enterococcus faecium]|nr:hypothetical protein AL020_03610 [Enterococcus faecium]
MYGFFHLHKIFYTLVTTRYLLNHYTVSHTLLSINYYKNAKNALSIYFVIGHNIIEIIPCIDFSYESRLFVIDEKEARQTLEW